MNPAAPVTSSFIRAPPGRPAAPPASAAAGGRARLPSTDHAGPPGRPRKLLGRAGRELHLAAGQREDLAGELEPRAAAGGRQVVDAEVLALDQRGQRLGQVAGEGGAADLVVDHAQLGTEAQHRVHEVASAGAEEPGGAHDEVARVGRRGRALALELRAPVARQRSARDRIRGRARACARRTRSRSRRRPPRPRPSRRCRRPRRSRAAPPRGAPRRRRRRSRPRS